MPVFKIFFMLILFMFAFFFTVSCGNEESKSQEDSSVSYEATDEESSLEEQIILSTTANQTTTQEAVSHLSGKEGISIDTFIFLDDGNTVINGKGASFSDNTVTISSPGTYSFKGNLTDGRILVNTDNKNKKVKLYLDGVSITSGNGSPLFIESSPKETVIILADGSKNTLTDSESTEENAVIYTKSSLLIEGKGSLTLTGKAGKGIFSEKNVSINSGSLIITSPDDGISCKNNIKIIDGKISITVGDNALHGSDIYINDGYIHTDTSGESLNSKNSITMKNGTLIIFGSSDDSAEKHRARFTMEGGTLLALGDGNIADSLSPLKNIEVLTFNCTRQADSLTVITDSDGRSLIGFSAPRNYSDIFFACDIITGGETYSIYAGGSFDTSDNNGIYTDGSYTEGTLLGTLTR